MARPPRVKSNSGIYHIMLRGVHRQSIFHDEEDRIRFLYTLEKYKEESGYQVFAWCLMDNHVHLLLKEGAENLAVSMKRIGVSFVWFYNMKYNTSGHLFQGRFRSEAIENSGHLLSVIRYIHLNPVKAGMVKKPGEWRWSSYRSYLGNKDYPCGLLDPCQVLQVFSMNRESSIRQLIDHHQAANEDEFLDDIIKIRFTDEMARAEIKKLIAGCNLAEIKAMPKTQRDELLSKFKKITGISQRQISRLLGLPLGLINRIK